MTGEEHKRTAVMPVQAAALPYLKSPFHLHNHCIIILIITILILILITITI